METNDTQVAPRLDLARASIERALSELHLPLTVAGDDTPDPDAYIADLLDSNLDCIIPMADRDLARLIVAAVNQYGAVTALVKALEGLDPPALELSRFQAVKAAMNGTDRFDIGVDTANDWWRDAIHAALAPFVAQEPT